MGLRKSAKLASICMAMGLLASDVYCTPDDTVNQWKPPTDRDKKRIAKDHGLKEFTIDGITVMALNEKNAIKKVNKLKNQ